MSKSPPKRKDLCPIIALWSHTIASSDQWFSHLISEDETGTITVVIRRTIKVDLERVTGREMPADDSFLRGAVLRNLQPVVMAPKNGSGVDSTFLAVRDSTKVAPK